MFKLTQLNISQLKIKLPRTIMWKISVSDSKYHTGFEILTPASPNTHCWWFPHKVSLLKETWRDKICFERSCFWVLHDLLTKKGRNTSWYYMEHIIQCYFGVFRKKQRPWNLNIQWNPNIKRQDPLSQNSNIHVGLSPSIKSTSSDSFMT